MTEEEKKAIEIVKNIEYNKNIYMHESLAIAKVLSIMKKQQEEIERYKRLAEQNLKDSEEFKSNMCEHRCIKNNETLELQKEIEGYKKTLADVHAQYLNNSIAKEKEHEEQLKMLNEGWKIELEKKDKIASMLKRLKEQYKIALEKNSIEAFILKCKIECLEELEENNYENI